MYLFVLVCIFMLCYTRFVARALQRKEGKAMPQVRFTNAWLQSVKPEDGKGTWYSESGSKGLRLYVGASGKKTWYLNYRRSGEDKVSQHKIGDADYFSVSQARDAALKFLAAVKSGETPWVKPEIPEKLTLEALLNIYEPWVVEYRRSGMATLALIRSSFPEFLMMDVGMIDGNALEQWMTKARKERGLKASSVNREVTALKAMLNWAAKRGVIEAHALTRVERLREDDSNSKVRYLSPDEKKRLYAVLESCEEKNSYLKPMVIVSLNTGIRRGSLFQLKWSDIDFQEGILTVPPFAEKSGKLVHIPMSAKVIETLKAWKEQTGGEGLVFPSPKTGEVMDNCKRAWAGLLKMAGIENFRWHDMRHDFASQLVMRGVDLNTVRELMGHADMKMTLRYAHLAPQVKKAAIELLQDDLPVLDE